MINGFKKSIIPNIKYGDIVNIKAGIINYGVDDEIRNNLKKIKQRKFTLDEIDNKILKSIKKEKEQVDKCISMLDLWYEQAKETNILRMEKQYLSALERFNEYGIKNKLNVFQEEKAYSATLYSIVNKTYALYIRKYEDRDYRTDKVEKYEVSYTLYTNNQFINGKDRKIIANTKRKFTTEEETNKYIEGRKKAFGKYFKEDCPPILEGCENAFKINGMLLETYKVADKL